MGEGEPHTNSFWILYFYNPFHFYIRSCSITYRIYSCAMFSGYKTIHLCNLEAKKKSPAKRNSGSGQNDLSSFMLLTSFSLFWPGEVDIFSGKPQRASCLFQVQQTSYRQLHLTSIIPHRSTQHHLIYFFSFYISKTYYYTDYQTTGVLLSQGCERADSSIQCGSLSSRF